MSWTCALCGGDHSERPVLEVCIASCCHRYVRACDRIVAFTVEQINAAIDADHARQCERARGAA